MTSQLAILGGEKAITRAKPPWPVLTDEMVDAVVGALRNTRWSVANRSGSIEELENAYREQLGAQFALATASGTAALDAAMFAVGIEPGDEVITSPLVPGYAIMPIVHFHGRPVFVDVDYRTHNIDPALIEKRITARTKAILIVHCNGHPADMDAILPLARKYSLRLVEDCAHAQGATYKGKACGTFGDIACFSIQSYKNVPGGEGGVLTTNTRLLYERAMLCGQHPIRLEQCLTDPSLRKYISSGGLGWNHRLHPLAAVLALKSLAHVDEWLALRRESARYLAEKLSTIPGLTPTYVAPEIEHAYYCHPIIYKQKELGGLTLEKYVGALQAEGVDALCFDEPAYRAHVFGGKGEIFGRGCPLGCNHSEGEIDYSPALFPEAERVIRTQFRFGGCGFPFHDRELLDEYLTAFRKVSSQAGELL
ncbi:MAG: DegT/DnrJ/EryC1/StrS family aminotransferase [Kiritimatiellae bacterium]|nr:DegT/DnrJ/EryC1/StrS family aminotransferase [Kiritimatiellia bacterium]